MAGHDIRGFCGFKHVERAKPDPRRLPLPQYMGATAKKREANCPGKEIIEKLIRVNSD